jgi:hypothetical protein
MNILIAGAGKVGYNLAKALSGNHNVIIIDKKEKALNTIKDTLDVMTIKGDMREVHTFLNIEEKIDFYIAVTNNDEVNLISTIVVRNLIEVENIIVRLSNTSYMATNFQTILNINRVIYPYKLSATAVAKLLEFPKANNIKEFPFSDYVLISVSLYLFANGYDALTSLTASIACVGNIGPGFGNVGPADNFAFFTDTQKFILSIGMIIGRLEFFTVLILLSREFWKKF